MSAKIHALTVFEDSGFSLMARVQGSDAANVQQADISSIAYSVFDLSDTTTATATGTLTVASVVFDSLQTDARWTEDSTGYNFRWDVPASIGATGDKVYRIEIAFTPASGEVFHAVFEARTVGLYRS
jgi:hypothetical protein